MSATSLLDLKDKIRKDLESQTSYNNELDYEESILQLVSEILTGSGYRVDTATDGESALRRVDQGKYDFAVCDWKMPGMNGREFFEKLSVTHPALAHNLIFMSGDVIKTQNKSFIS